MTSRSLRSFFPGETVRVRVSFSDEADAPVAVSGVAFAVRGPGGAVASSAATQEAPSVYYTDITATAAGEWAVRATASAPSSSAVEVRFVVAQSLVLT